MSATGSFAANTWLVAQREIGSKLRSKAFVISFLIVFVVALGAVIWGGVTANTSSRETTKVAVTSESEQFIANLDRVEAVPVADRAAAEAAIEDGAADAAVLTDPESPLGYGILAEKEPPSSLVGQLSLTPPVELLDPDDSTNWLGYIVALGLGLLFMLSAQLFGATIVQSVIEEKQTRVVELLISAIPTRALLAGKVIGNTVLAMGQVVILAALILIGLSITGQAELLSEIGAPLIWFAVFFLFGFTLLAAMFAAAASMVSRQEDAGATTTPVMMLVLAPYFLVLFFWNNPTVLAVMSYVPFSAPVGMPLRIYLGSAQWWEPLLALVILVASCAVAIVVGARIYENSLLRMGGRVKLREALKS